MQIESTDALRAWLKQYLERQSDADPIALSKYVLALIKKDKSESELKKSMLEQMDVFLQQETEPFVAALFETLASKEYLKALDNVVEEDSVQKGIRDMKKEKEEGDSIAVEGNEDDKVPDSTTPIRGAEDEAEGARARSGERYRRMESERYERRRSPLRRSGGRRSPPRRFRSRSPGQHHRRGASPPPPPFRQSRSGGRRSPFRARSRSYSPPHKNRRAAEPEVSRGSTPIKDEENPYKRPRCRDYDEKGFCMRGDQCKFDHGNDAVVLDENTPGAPAAAPPPYNPMFPGAATPADPYIPTPASAPMPPLHLPPPGYPVPPTLPMDPTGMMAVNPRKRPYDVDAGAYGRGGGFRGRGFRGRGGRGRGGRGGAPQLAVRNIPPPLNNIAHLNNHFARFGTLVNVQVQFEGDPASALVSFANPAEAEMAMTSADAVLGNRFIKMHYHYDKPTVQMHPAKRVSIKDRLGEVARPPKDGEEVQFDGDQIIKTIPNTGVEKTDEEKAEIAAKREEDKVIAIAAIKKNQEMLEARVLVKREAEEKRKEQLKAVAEIQKSKQELLEKLIDEQKKLISMLDGKKLKTDDKAAVMTMIKDLSTKIDKAKEDVKAAMLMSASPAGKRNPAQLQKELLDAELELFQAQQDGSENAPELQRKVNSLRFEAARGGFSGRTPRGRGFRGRARGGYFRGGFRGRGRGSFVMGGGMNAGTSVDRRPSKLLVAGFVAEDKDEVIAHFSKFGEIVDTAEADETSMIVHYKTRREAEVAMNGAKAFGEKELELSWYTTAAVVDYTAELEHSVSVESEHGEDVDDYTPLDPTYLPAGLEEEEDVDEEKKEGEEGAEENDGEPTPKEDTDDVVLQTTAAEENELLYNEDEEEEETESGERSWKR